MEEKLQRAIDVLSIDLVAIRSSSARLSDDFDPKFESDHGVVTVKLHSHVEKFDLVTVHDETDERFLRVLIECGVTLVRPPENDSGDGEDSETLASIEAQFAAYYSMSEHPGQEALEQFVLHNASFQVWPYWREYLASQCLRMNLAPITAPMRQFGPQVKGSARDEES